MSTYLVMWGIAAGAFTLGWIFRGLIALGDVRQLEEYEARDRAEFV